MGHPHPPPGGEPRFLGTRNLCSDNFHIGLKWPALHFRKFFWYEAGPYTPLSVLRLTGHLADLTSDRPPST